MRKALSHPSNLHLKLNTLLWIALMCFLRTELFTKCFKQIEHVGYEWVVYMVNVCAYSWIVFAHLFELKKWSFIYVKEGGCLITVMIVYEGGEGVLK